MLLVILFCGAIPQAQAIANEKPLSAILEELGERYQVFFTYDAEELGKIDLDFTINHGETLDQAVTRLLAKTTYSFESFDGKYYVIYEKSKAGRKKAKKIRRHIKGIQKLESSGIDLNRMQTDPVKQLNDVVQRVFKVGLEKPITGTVTGEDGEPLIGANVLIKGTAIGTVTDLDGKYTLNVPDENAVLVISYTGYETREIAVGAQSIIDIQMEVAIAEFQEIVVTALGIERETKALGYSVTEVEGEALMRNRDPNVMNQLVGRVAGVNVSKPSTGPGGSSRVVIRGNSSLGGNNQPLYVVDGVPIDNSNLGAAGAWGGSDRGDGVSSLNPDDIESLSVLKGAAAAALYGSRASNGVIIVKTKSGSKREGIGIEINSNFVAEEVVSQTDWQTEYGIGSNGQKPTTLQQAQDFGMTNYGGKLDGSSVIQFDGVSRPYSYAGNAMDAFYRTGHTITNTVTLTGGGETASFRFSASDLRNESVQPNSGVDRNTYGTNLNFKKGKFTAAASGTYVHQDIKNAPNVGNWAWGANFMLQAVPNTLDVRNLRGDPNKLGTDPATGNELSPSSNVWIANPYFIVYQDQDNSQKERVFGNVSARFDFTDWLYVQGRLGLDLYNFKRTFLTATGQAFRKDGSLDLEDRRLEETNNDVMIGINKALGNGLAINALLGGSQQKITRELVFQNGSNFAIPNFHTWGNLTNQSSRTNLLETGINSFYYQAEVSYNSIYLTTTGRQDWFSTLDGKGIFYPSVGLSAVLTDMFNMNAFDFLKIRGSWAEVGGGAPAPYGTAFNYTLGNPHGGFAQGFINGSRVPNLDLRPYTTTEYEIGFDARFLDGRIGVDFAYYDRETDGDILGVQIPHSSGFTNRLVNLGVVSNSGIELLVNADVIKKADFKWTTSFNFANNKSEVVSLAGSDDPDERRTLNNPPMPIMIVNQVGKPFGQLWGSTYERDANGNIVVDEASGLPVKGKDIAFGSGVAPTTGGWSNTVWYKDFSLSALIDFRFGGYIYSGTNNTAYERGTHKATLEGRENGIGVVPAADVQNYYNHIRNNISEDFVYKSDFVKFRELSVNYNFPRSMLDSTPFASITLSAVGRNLWILHKEAENIDPESSTNAGNAQGYEWGVLPNARTFGLNLNVKF